MARGKISTYPEPQAKQRPVTGDLRYPPVMHIIKSRCTKKIDLDLKQASVPFLELLLVIRSRLSWGRAEEGGDGLV